MAQVPSFDLEAALAGNVRLVGSVNWVSQSPSSIESIGPFDRDASMAIVQAPAHGLKAGDRVFLGELGFMIDGFYEVVDHPLAEHRDNAFAVAIPEALGDRSLKSGKLYRPHSFAVSHPEHLSVTGATEIKKLGMDQLANFQAQQGYQSLAEEIGMINIAVSELAIALKITPEDRDKFRNQLELLARLKDEDLISRAMDGIKKTFHITQKKGEADIKKVCDRLRDLNETFKIDVDDFVESFDRQALELKKREIEILCEMPKGHMSALDKMASITNVIESIHAYIESAVKESDIPSVGNETPAAA
jgi:hypothetical protein